MLQLSARIRHAGQGRHGGAREPLGRPIRVFPHPVASGDVRMNQGYRNSGVGSGQSGQLRRCAQVPSEDPVAADELPVLGDLRAALEGAPINRTSRHRGYRRPRRTGTEPAQARAQCRVPLRISIAHGLPPPHFVVKGGHRAMVIDASQLSIQGRTRASKCLAVNTIDTDGVIDAPARVTPTLALLRRRIRRDAAYHMRRGRCELPSMLDSRRYAASAARCRVPLQATTAIDRPPLPPRPRSPSIRG